MKGQEGEWSCERTKGKRVEGENMPAKVATYILYFCAYKI